MQAGGEMTSKRSGGASTQVIFPVVEQHRAVSAEAPFMLSDGPVIGPNGEVVTIGEMTAPSRTGAFLWIPVEKHCVALIAEAPPLALSRHRQFVIHSVISVIARMSSARGTATLAKAVEEQRAALTAFAPIILDGRCGHPREERTRDKGSDSAANAELQHPIKKNTPAEFSGKTSLDEVALGFGHVASFGEVVSENQ
jgi:hypothetical protein